MSLPCELRVGPSDRKGTPFLRDEKVGPLYPPLQDDQGASPRRDPPEQKDLGDFSRILQELWVLFLLWVSVSPSAK